MQAEVLQVYFQVYLGVGICGRLLEPTQSIKFPDVMAKPEGFSTVQYLPTRQRVAAGADVASSTVSFR